MIIGLAALATIWIYRWQIRLGEQYRPEEVGPRADVMTIVGVILPAALIGWIVCPQTAVIQGWIQTLWSTLPLVGGWTPRGAKNALFYLSAFFSVSSIVFAYRMARSDEVKRRLRQECRPSGECLACRSGKLCNEDYLPLINFPKFYGDL